jgi:hypothetical protein
MEPSKPAAKAAVNEITGAYKRKEYGWFVFYIATVVICARLAGAIGAAVSVLVVFYLYRAINNSAYSATKKVVLSAVYVIGGVVGTVILATLFTYGLAYIWPRGVADQVLKDEPPLQTTPFASNSTPSLLKGENPAASPDLENNNS